MTISDSKLAPPAPAKSEWVTVVLECEIAAGIMPELDAKIRDILSALSTMTLNKLKVHSFQVNRHVVVDQKL